MIREPSGRPGHCRPPGSSEKPCRIMWRAVGLVWTSGARLRARIGTVPAGVHRTAFCKQLGSMARLKAPLSAFGLDEWGQLRIFFGRNNSYSLVRFVLAGPGRRWDTAARKPNHSVEWLAVPLFSNTLFFLARGKSPLGSAMLSTIGACLADVYARFVLRAGTKIQRSTDIKRDSACFFAGCRCNF